MKAQRAKFLAGGFIPRGFFKAQTGALQLRSSRRAISGGNLPGRDGSLPRAVKWDLSPRPFPEGKGNLPRRNVSLRRYQGSLRYARTSFALLRMPWSEHRKITRKIIPVFLLPSYPLPESPNLLVSRSPLSLSLERFNYSSSRRASSCGIMPGRYGSLPRAVKLDLSNLNFYSSLYRPQGNKPVEE